MIIGGSDAWLDINIDEDNLINPKKPELGYNKGSNGGPFYEPKGSVIETSLLSFLIDNNEDADDLLKKRNKDKPVHFYIPFSQENRMLIKVREISDQNDVPEDE